METTFVYVATITTDESHHRRIVELGLGEHTVKVFDDLHAADDYTRGYVDGK